MGRTGARRGLWNVAMMGFLAGCNGDWLLHPNDRDHRPPRGLHADDGDPQDTGEPPPENHAPVLYSVTISPEAIYADGFAHCAADFEDPDGDPVTPTFTWRNRSRGTTLGTGNDLTLRPDEILPGEHLDCSVRIEDPSGAMDSMHTSVEPVCGLYDINDLDDIDYSMELFFRPWTTDELRPGYGGMPWDWDGSIPDEVFALANLLDTILDLVSAVYPSAEVMSADQLLEQLIEIGYLIDENAPALLAATVPPDPDLYPYMVDSEGYIQPFWDASEGDMRWDNAYQISTTGAHLDLYTDPWLVFDMEDIDLLSDDNMGDWIDQGDVPLMLGWELFYEGAYCTSTFYNPTDYAQSSDVAYLPSSILYLALTVD